MTTSHWKKISAVGSTLGILRAPAIVAAIGAALYCGPDQMLEVYRVMAEGEHPQYLLFGLLTQLLAIVVLWSCGRQITLLLRPQALLSATIEGMLLRWLPRLSAASLAVSLGIGLWEAASDARLSPIHPSLVEQSHSLALLQNAINEMATASVRLQLMAVMAWLVAFGVLAGVYLAHPAVGARLRALCLPPRTAPRWIAFAVLASASLSFALVCWPGISTQLGTLALANLFVAWLSICLAGLFLASDARGVPALSLCFAAAFLFSWAGLNNNHVVRQVSLTKARESWDAGGPTNYFTQWLSSRGDLDHYQEQGIPYPVIIVAARGGGIYAAAQSALFLARMQDQCPLFSQHVFAISSVSGGSIGAAAFVAYVKNHAQNRRWVGCDWADHPMGPAEALIGKFLSRDMLSPLVGSTLFPDLLQRFLFWPVPAFDRGLALERGIERNWASVDPTGPNPFEGLFLDIADSRSAVPALLFNTTEVESGRREIIAPFPVDVTAPNLTAWFYDEPGVAPFFQRSVQYGRRPKIIADLRLSTAAGLSARFPFILPAATVLRGDGAVHLVDGGYFDNSGIETAQDLAEFLANARDSYRRDGGVAPQDPRLHFRVFVVILGGLSTDYTTEAAPSARATAEELLAPINALLSARVARGDMTAYRIGSAQNVANISQGTPLYDVMEPGLLDHRDFQLSLGFQLSGAALQMISAEMSAGNECGKMNDLDDHLVDSFYPNGVPNRSGRIRDLMHGNSCQQCMVMDTLDPTEDLAVKNRPYCPIPPRS
jgi:hypothetical protein